jgi:septum formation protein
MNEIILASQSVGRKKLFHQYFESFKISVSNIDESKIRIADPHELVKRLAYLKTAAVAKFYSNDFVMGFDTLVMCEDRVLGKPRTKEDAKETLRFLSGKYQSVITGYCIIHGNRRIEVNDRAETKLHFASLTEDFIQRYCEEQPVTRFAGAYAVQDHDAFVNIESGTMENIVGAPMDVIVKYLQDWGVYEALKKSA